MNTWAIGDVHGYASILSALLDFIPLGNGDRIVFLGDLIDRGPQTPEVLETIHRLRRQHEVILVRGNHEQMMLKARYDRDARREWILSGGDATADAYNAQTMDKIPDDVWLLLQSTLPYFETNTAIYVHANLDPHVELSSQCEHDLSGISARSRHRTFQAKRWSVVTLFRQVACHACGPRSFASTLSILKMERDG